jgi:phenylacetate-CoA ligase
MAIGDLTSFQKSWLVAQMKLNQWKSPESLERIQENKLWDMLSHARSTVPYYRKALQGLEGRSSDSLETFSSLPILDKKTVRVQGSALLSNSFREKDLLHVKTSGSTGTPLDLYFDYKSCIYGNALRHHLLTECRFGPLDRLVNLTTDVMPSFFLGQLFRAIQLPFSDEGKAFEALGKLKPDVALSHPSFLLMLARLNQTSRAPLSIRSIITISELLTNPAREEIKKSFSCDLRDFYGARECWGIAWECEKGSMHICSDSVILEILDPEGNPVKEGKEGDVVITPLWNPAMPLIRYRLGDRAVLGSRCPCGRTLPVLKKLLGRDDDLVTLPSGKKRSLRSLNITRTFALHEGTREFQIIQERADFFVIKYVPYGEGLSDKDKKQITGQIKTGCLGELISVEFEEVSSIQNSATGKIRKFLSKVKTARAP